MLSALRNIVLTTICLLIASSKAHSQNKTYSLIEELMLAVDSSCTGLVAEPISPEIHESYAKEYHSNIYSSYFELYENNTDTVIDSKTLIEILKNKPVKGSSKMFVQDSFKKIKILTPDSIDSFLRLNMRNYPIKFRGYSKASQPVFDKKKEYAIIDYHVGQGAYWGGCIYLLKKVKNKWIVLANFECWIN